MMNVVNVRVSQLMNVNVCPLRSVREKKNMPT
jgi:hypothetical protein